MSDHAEIIRKYLLRTDKLSPFQKPALSEAVAALDGLLADHAAENERLNQRLEAYVSSADALAAVMYERDEARAENERQRIRYGSFLDWAIGYVSESEGPYFERLHERLTDERAALAPAQEPPAAPCYVCGHPVAEGEGWRRDSKTWCPDHRPVWSHD